MSPQKKSFNHFGLKSAKMFIFLMFLTLCTIFLSASNPGGEVASEKGAALAAGDDSAAKTAISQAVENLFDVKKSDSAVIKGLLPENTVLSDVGFDSKSNRITVFIDMPYKEFADDSQIGELYKNIAYYLSEKGFGKQSIELRALDRDKGAYVGIAELMPPDAPLDSKPLDDAKEKPIDKSEPSVKSDTTPIDSHNSVLSPGQPTGFLTGKTVFVSQGHGWYWDGSTWTTQRGNYGNLVEDLHNAELSDYYLWRYFWNAGANTFTCRERDVNTSEVIIDNLSAGYSETGTWYDSTGVTGYYGTNYRYANIAATETATATFTPTIPKDGYYAVYLWYPSSTARPSDMKVRIYHTGGVTEWIQNEQRDGKTWKNVGFYYFKAGSNPSTGKVVISNQSSNTPGSIWVVADAVKFGGGMGDNDRGGGISGKPRFEECSRYWAQFAGAPSSVYDPSTLGDNTDDVTCRPRYCEWERESWEDAVYISQHTNAYLGQNSGTSSFAQSSGGWDEPFDGSTGSIDLRDKVHSELMNDIRYGYDEASWSNDGTHTNNYGELRLLSNMPGAIFELAFHDDMYNGTDEVKDDEFLKDPKFRMICARAMYQGVVKYFAARDSVTATLLPEPPTNLRTASGNGQATISWSAPPYNTGNGVLGDAATGYNVYISTDGKGFILKATTTSTSTVVSGLTNGSVYYFRVSATNAGGESFESETVAAKPIASGSAPILIVCGFDRVDRFLPPLINNVRRCFLERFNTFDYVIAHASSINNAGKYFDCASNEAVENSLVNLANYQCVVWIGGQQSEVDSDDATDFTSVNSTLRTKIKNYLTGGGSLFITSSELAWDLDRNTDQTDEPSVFVQDYLKGNYVDDDVYSSDTPVNLVSGTSGSIFDGLTGITFDNGDDGIYSVDFPDVVSANGGSSVAMTYNGSSESVVNAGIQYSGAFKVVYLGFPFETIFPESSRNSIMTRVLNFLLPSGPTPTPTPTPSPSPTPSPTLTPTPTPVGGAQYKLTDFETYTAGTKEMFQDPAFSGSTTGVNTSTDVSEVSSAQTNNILDPSVASLGSKSYRLYWQWTTAGTGFVRDTTYNTTNKPNPIIDLTKGLSIYVKCVQGEVDMTYYVRETGVSGTIGDNGGVSGTIEKCSRSVRLTASSNWQYVYFDIPNETYTAVTGNGTLDGSYGTLEALIFNAVGSSSATDIEIFIDDLYQGPQHNPGGATPTPTPTPSPSPTPSATPTPTPSPTPTPAVVEWRGFWADAWHDGYKNATQVSEMIATAKSNNYNAVVVQIRKRGDAYYFPTSPNTEPRASDISSGFDPLLEIINQAHAQGIEVHAWIPTFLIWSSETAPSSSAHVYNVHPEYLMKDSSGNTYIAEGSYLDPGNPDANKWNYNVVMDLVQHYNIDGIHFDYIRYPQQDSGYNDVAIQRYNAEYGLTGQPSSSSSQFSTWRRRQITDWLRNTYTDIIAVKPNLKVTAAVFASRSDAYSYRFQDWKAWMQNNQLDALLPMNYATSDSTFTTRTDDIVANKYNRHVYMGNGAYLVSKETTVTQLNYARGKGCEGLLNYSYAETNSSGDLDSVFYAYIKTNLFTQPASIPTMTWKTAPTGGYLRGKVTDSSTGNPLYNATVTISQLSASCKTDGEGKYSFTYITPGTNYSVTCQYSGLLDQTATLNVTAGNVATQNFAMGTSPTPTPAITPVWTPTPSPSPTPSATPTRTPTPTPSISPTPSRTPTPTPAISPTPTQTPTPTPTKTPTPTPSPTPSPTAIPKIFNEPWTSQGEWQCWTGGSATSSTYADWNGGKLRCKFPTTSGWPSPGWNQWLKWNTGHTGIEYSLSMAAGNLYVLKATLSANKNIDVPGIRIRVANQDNAWFAQANFEYYPSSPAPVGGFPTQTPGNFYIVWQPQGTMTGAYIAIDNWAKSWTGEVYVDEISVYSIPLTLVTLDRQEKDITNFSSGWASGGTAGITIGTNVQFGDLSYTGTLYHNLGGYVTLNNAMSANYLYRLKYYWAKSGSNKVDDIRMRVNDAYNGAADSEFLFVDQDAVTNNVSTTAKEYLLYHWATNPRLTGTGDLAIWADGIANVQTANNSTRILSRIIIEKVSIPPLN